MSSKRTRAEDDERPQGLDVRGIVQRDHTVEGAHEEIQAGDGRIDRTVQSCLSSLLASSAGAGSGAATCWERGGTDQINPCGVGSYSHLMVTPEVPAHSPLPTPQTQ